MSLKTFHLVFVVLSVLMCGWVTAWGVHEYRHHGDGGAMGLAVVCAVLGLGLVLYGVKVLAKFREIESQ